MGDIDDRDVDGGVGRDVGRTGGRDVDRDRDREGGAAAPRWYWAVAVAALLWEAMGCFAYLSQMRMSPAEMAALPAAQRDIWLAMPAWLGGVYAIAVWVGLCGAAALLLRRRWARTCFIVSLLAVLVQFGWVFAATPILQSMGAGAAAFPLLIVLIAALLVRFSLVAVRRGWLR
nr:hypothetical protein [Sphingomonas sp. SCN 67-18]